MSDSRNKDPVTSSRRVISGEEAMSLFRSFEKTMFRLETFDAYAVEGDAILPQYLAGDPLPPEPNKYQLEWWGLITDSTKQGKEMSRVHIIPDKLTPYLRYEIDWGYTYNAIHGEKVFLVSRDANKRLSEIASEDFYLLDDRTLVFLNYKKDGSFVGYEVETDPETVRAYSQIKSDLVEAAVPLKEYLAKVRNQ